MYHSLQYSKSKPILSLGLITLVQVGLTLPSPGQYQTEQYQTGQYQSVEEDIVIIGDTPEDWSRYRTYWQDLLQLNPIPQSSVSPSSKFESSESKSPNGWAIDHSESTAREAELKKNLIVTELKFKTILRLSGSSQVIGTLKNNNQESVTVSAVNFEIVDEEGRLIRSGAAAPQPNTIAPGQSVTFNSNFFGLPRRPAYEVRLMDSPLSLGMPELDSSSAIAPQN